MMTLLILTLFVFKHFFVDFPMQTPYMYLNKGTYLHPGGLLHSGIHGIATFLILLPFTHFTTAIALGVLDYQVHYHIDWAKVKINRKFGWKPDNSEKFWTLLGLDQLLHMLTYLAFAYILLDKYTVQL